MDEETRKGLSLSPSKVRKAREAFDFLSSLPFGSDVGPSGLSSSSNAGPSTIVSCPPQPAKKGEFILHIIIIMPLLPTFSN